MSYIYVWKGELFILYKLSTCIMLFERADASLCYFSLKNTDEILINQGFCLLVFVRKIFFPLTLRRHKYRWKTANFDLYSALFHGHWAMRVLLRATPTVIRNIHLYGHLRGPVTLSVAERKYKMQNAKYKKCS